MRIYLDNCCYNRPLDDQNQDRIYIESEVIKAIFAKSQLNKWVILGSEVLEFEINNCKDYSRKLSSLALYSYAKEKILLNDEIKSRAGEFILFGVKSLDALHLACAEYLNADILLSVDDKFIKSARKTNAKTKIFNPVEWLMEVTRYE